MVYKISFNKFLQEYMNEPTIILNQNKTIIESTLNKDVDIIGIIVKKFGRKRRGKKKQIITTIKSKLMGSDKYVMSLSLNENNQILINDKEIETMDFLSKSSFDIKVKCNIIDDKYINPIFLNDAFFVDIVFTTKNGTFKTIFNKKNNSENISRFLYSFQPELLVRKYNKN
jgi:hypothetical protein